MPLHTDVLEIIDLLAAHQRCWKLIKLILTDDFECFKNELILGIYAFYVLIINASCRVYTMLNNFMPVRTLLFITPLVCKYYNFKQWLLPNTEISSFLQPKPNISSFVTALGGRQYTWNRKYIMRHNVPSYLWAQHWYFAAIYSGIQTTMVDHAFCV